jgi:hypothetical protein
MAAGSRGAYEVQHYGYQLEMRDWLAQESVGTRTQCPVGRIQAGYDENRTGASLLEPPTEIVPFAAAYEQLDDS